MNSMKEFNCRNLTKEQKNNIINRAIEKGEVWRDFSTELFANKSPVAVHYNNQGGIRIIRSGNAVSPESVFRQEPKWIPVELFDEDFN